MAPMRCRSPTNFMRWQHRSVKFDAPQFLSWKIPSSDQQRDTTRHAARPPGWNRNRPREPGGAEARADQQCFSVAVITRHTRLARSVMPQVPMRSAINSWNRRLAISTARPFASQYRFDLIEADRLDQVFFKTCVERHLAVFLLPPAGDGHQCR